jgi:hypothetical protein
MVLVIAKARTHARNGSMKFKLRTLSELRFIRLFELGRATAGFA